MAPSTWANKVVFGRDLGLIDVLAVINFLRERERRSQITEEEVVWFVSRKYGVTYKWVVQQIDELHEKQIVYTEHQFLFVHSKLLNRVFN